MHTRPSTRQATARLDQMGCRNACETSPRLLKPLRGVAVRVAAAAQPRSGRSRLTMKPSEGHTSRYWWYAQAPMNFLSVNRIERSQTLLEMAVHIRIEAASLLDGQGLRERIPHHLLRSSPVAHAAAAAAH